MKSVFLIAGLAASVSTTLITPDIGSILPAIMPNPFLVRPRFNQIKNGNFELNPLGDGDWIFTK